MRPLPSVCAQKRRAQHPVALISRIRTATLQYQTPLSLDKLDKMLMAGFPLTVDFSISNIFSAIPESVRHALTVRFRRGPIATIDDLIDFIETRAAYVAQTSLYGYLKTRMGTRYRVMFEDEVFSKSIDHAKWRTYASCLSDLAIFCVGTAVCDSKLNKDESEKMACFCFNTAVRQTFIDVVDDALAQQVIDRFAERAGQTDWRAAATGENAFERSPADLIRWAPVVDEFKELDREIVTNSTRYRWRDIREQLRKRIDAQAICSDWRARPD